VATKGATGETAGCRGMLLLDPLHNGPFSVEETPTKDTSTKLDYFSVISQELVGFAFII